MEPRTEGDASRNLRQGRLLEPPPVPAVRTSPEGVQRHTGQDVIASRSQSAAASETGSSLPCEDGNATAETIGSSTHPVHIGVQNQDIEQEQVHETGKRYKRLTSDVWNYFTKKKEIIEENGKKCEQIWGYCNFPNCKRRYRAEGRQGTTAFKNHLRSAHSIVRGQQQLKFEKDLGNNITHIQPFMYDQEVSVKKLIMAIIMHDYPFNIVEHGYFVDFIKSLHPSFPIKSCNAVGKEVMDTYLEEKEKLYAHLKTVHCRFSVTMDMWTSCSNKSYMCVTVHWINADWCIQKRIIGFFNVKGRHTGKKLSETFTEAMVRWNLDKKLFSLTLDNASANEMAVKDIISDLKDGQASLVCDGLFFHVRCACHILNLVARDGLKVISKTIDKIKALVLAVKGSPLQWKELMKCASESELDTKRGISLDVSARWNSTYLMLRDALYYKDAFARLKSSNRHMYVEIYPSPDEWDMALKIFQCLKKVYSLAEILSGTSYPTANLFYRGFCDIKVLLDDWCSSDDATISEMAIAMSQKIEKYWEHSNLALAVACFLDPRYKKKVIEYYMKKFHGDGYHVELEKIVNVVRGLYCFYSSSTPAPAKSTSPEPANSASDILMASVSDELDSFLYGTNEPTLVRSNELEKYMADPLLRLGGPFDGPFDILAWWKSKREVYPILSQIVRDVMAIQVSTVASESVFNAAGRFVDPYRNRLEPEMVEALICTKDWIAAERKDSKIVGSIVSDLEIETLSTVMANKIRAVDDKDIEWKDQEHDGENEYIDSDLDVMDDHDEL